MKRLLAAIVAALLALTGALITSPASASPTTGFECYVHQGESRNGPHGNTAAAFRAAVRYHTDIETDLRVTKNGFPVIFHDPHMWDVAGHDRTVGGDHLLVSHRGPQRCRHAGSNHHRVQRTGYTRQRGLTSELHRARRREPGFGYRHQ